MKTFLLKIVTPNRELLSQAVEHVLLPGADGYFGVWAGHTPLLAILDIGATKFRSPDSERSVTLSGGYAEVLPDSVTVIARSAEFAEEITIDRAEAARKRALDRLTSRPAGTDVLRAKSAMGRAMLRLDQARQAGKSAPKT